MRTICLFAILLITSWSAFAQENIGFEKGTFDNWEFAVGKIEVSGEITTYFSSAVPGSFALLENNKTGIHDDYGNFSVFSPNGGKYSVKLGNTLFGTGAQKMSYKFKVPPTGSSSIIFNYAVVLGGAGHEPKQLPRFAVKVYDLTDDKYLDCPSFDFIVSGNLPGFKVVNDSIFYKDWASASINLKGLNNKDIRLEFTVNHCPFGHHFAYAYIDINEDIGAPIKGNNYCPNQAAITLAAPPGFAKYTWYNAGFTTMLGDGQYLNMASPPDLTAFAVIVKPYNGIGCADTLYTTVHQSNSEFKFVAKDTVTGCPGTAVDLTQANVTAGSSPDLKFDYLTDKFELLPSPFHITQSGLYYIRATNAGGCSDLLPVTVSFGLPQLDIVNPAIVTYPATVDLSGTFAPQPGVTYTYYRDAAANRPLTDFTDVNTSGKYWVKAENASGCVNMQPVVVTVQPPAPFSLNAPNTFTPNNDGINDHFFIALGGYITFKGMRIYNRNGALIFRTVDAAQFWDGTYKGKQMPAGTYYWVFDGHDDYYQKNVSQSSFITLIR